MNLDDSCVVNLANLPSGNMLSGHKPVPSTQYPLENAFNILEDSNPNSMHSKRWKDHYEGQKMDNEIGLEAATLVSLETADNKTRPMKLALARAAQEIINIRNKLEEKHKGKKIGYELDSIFLALRHVADANFNATHAVYVNDLIIMRERRQAVAKIKAARKEGK